MSARATIDSLRFARSGECLSGEIPLRVLTRLVDLLATDAGTLHYRICGRSEGGRPTLCLDIEASVELVCQRCLEPYSEALHIDSHLPVARDEAELARWEHDAPLLDGLVAESGLDVVTLVEDEIILGLPVAPRHPEGGCGRGGAGSNT